MRCFPQMPSIKTGKCVEFSFKLSPIWSNSEFYKEMVARKMVYHPYSYNTTNHLIGKFIYLVWLIEFLLSYLFVFSPFYGLPLYFFLYFLSIQPLYIFCLCLNFYQKPKFFIIFALSTFIFTGYVYKSMQRQKATKAAL